MVKNDVLWRMIPMKKVLAFVLALVLTLTVGSVAAFAQGEELSIVIDGVKDDEYVDSMCLDDIWQYWYDETQAIDPVDPDRVKNTLWFRWDNDFVYLYFQCESKDPLYVPQETPPAGYNNPNYMPTFEEEWKTTEFCEYVRLFLDTAPSLGYDSPCRWYGVNQGQGERCEHFACAASDKSNTNDYRLMCRNYSAWGFWDDYYTANEGVFMDYEGWLSRRCDPTSPHYKEAYTSDPQGNYAANGGGNGQVASFIDYDTNTYGIEVKFRRAQGEEYFQFNVVTPVSYKDWEEEGPELPYTLSVNSACWLNSQDMFEIYYGDWETGPCPDLQVIALIRRKEQLAALDSIGLEHKDAVLKLYEDYLNLSEEEVQNLADLEPTFDGFISDALNKVLTLDYIANLGDINADGKVNANDALIALKAAVNKVKLSDQELARAEVTGDGAVNAKDALEMLQVAVGKREKFTIVKDLEI